MVKISFAKIVKEKSPRLVQFIGNQPRKVYYGVFGALASIVIAIIIIAVLAGSKTCRTEFCDQAALEVKSSMNSSIDPCDDFYQFACGGFLNSTELLYSSFKNHHTIIQKQIRTQLMKAMSEPIEPTDPQYIQNVKQLFTSCTNDYIGKGKKYAPKNCLKTVQKTLTLASNFLYANKIFKKGDYSSLNQMVFDIIDPLKDIIKQQSLFDEVREDDVNVHPIIGFSDEFYDEKFTEEYYNSLRLDNRTHDELREIMDDHKYNESFLQDKGDLWSFVVQSTVKDEIADILIDKSYLNIPMGMTQGFFYDNNRPHYMNYGTMGTEISSKLLRIFRDMGKYRRAEQRMSRFSNPEYENISECLSRYYGSYLVQELQQMLDGTYTFDENIADIHSFRIAYLGYKRWLKKNGVENQLPGLPYSNEQMFWINAARARCTKHSLDDLDKIVLDTDRAPPEYQIRGSFSNIPEFSEDFQCPLGSKMNPETKCKLD